MVNNYLSIPKGEAYKEVKSIRTYLERGPREPSWYPEDQPGRAGELPEERIRKGTAVLLTHECQGGAGRSGKVATDLSYD